jgi:glycosyltransferase involved in cell wall biosynthesis
MLIGGWIAREIERAGGCRQVHAHFALAQTEVAMAVSGLLDRPYSFTAHARDIYAAPSALEEKIRRAALVITCTAYNLNHLRRLCPDVPTEHIRLVHHGVDVDAAAGPARAATTCDAQRTPTIVAAGRLIEKKGFDALVQACEMLQRRGANFRCRIFGTGPLDRPLRSQIAAAGLLEKIEMPGWLPNARLLEEFTHATVFVMPSRISDSGDRDGIPNVVLEAMASGLPVVATAVSGLPEAVTDGVTGLLVAPDDPTAMADALQRLLTEPDLAGSFGAAGAARAQSEFSIEASTNRLTHAFGLTLPD